MDGIYLTFDYICLSDFLFACMVATHQLRKVPTSTASDIFAKVKGRTDAFFVENCINHSSNVYNIQ